MNINGYPRRPRRRFRFCYEWPLIGFKRSGIITQCFAAFAIFCMNFSASSMALTALLVEDMSETYNIALYIGLILGGVVAQLVGGQLVMIPGSAVIAAIWLSYRWVTSVIAIKCLVHFAGLAIGMIQSPSYVYLAEISQPGMRGALMATVHLSPIVGSYFSYLVSYLVEKAALEWIGPIHCIIPTIGILYMMIMLPESPYWLANKGYYDRMELSLKWFRGFSYANVKPEATKIINSSKNNPSFCSLFGQKKLYIPAIVVSYVFLIKAFVVFNHLTFLLKFGSSMILLNDKLKSILFFDASQVFPSVAFVFVVLILDKRIQLLISLLCGGMASLLASIFGYLNTSNSTYIYSWLLLICSAIAFFMFNAGLAQVPLLLNGELFPSRLRYVGAGFGLFFMNIAMYGSNELYLKSSLNIHDLLLIVACISIFGFISLLWLLPKNETESLVEIEQSCNSMHDLRRKKDNSRITA